MADLFRLVIAEANQFPELGETHFKLGKQPFYDSVVAYLRTQAEAGTMVIADPDVAATQFLGMIANFVLWPRMLLPAWSPSEGEIARHVEEAVATMHARYGDPSR
jgi:hypothetical protein